ncbi:MAG: DUF58 domain-containing protein [Pantoea sp.]|uniref:DUF58 domain-containing protein n=1 Tax=Pantoea sp. TaxID=69393 RepID=UPI0039E439CC
MSGGVTIDKAALMALASAAHQLNNPPGQIPPGAMSGERTSRQQGRGLNFDSLRRYQPGDDVRLIDWQATARLRSPWIRLYNEERERPVFLLVDQRLDMFFSTRNQTKSVAAASVAALLAWRSWHDGDRLGAVVFNDDEMRVHPCRSPRVTLPRLFDDLSQFNQQLPERLRANRTGPVRLAAVLQRLTSLLPPGSWLALISDFHDLDRQSEALLASLRQRAEMTAWVTLDDLHLHLPASGNLTAHYASDEVAFALTPALRTALQDKVSARLATQKQRLQRPGIAVRNIVVGQPLLPQLQQEDFHAGKRI